MSVAKSDQAMPKLTIRVLVDMVSIEAGYGHISASLSLIPALRKQYPDALIELVPLHESINPDPPGIGGNTMSYFVEHESLLTEKGEDGVENGQQLITEYLQKTFTEDESAMEQAKKMLWGAVEMDGSRKTKIINVKDYLSMRGSVAREDVVVVSGAFDANIISYSHPKAYLNQYGSKYPPIFKQPVGWKKGITKCTSLPPLPTTKAKVVDPSYDSKSVSPSDKGLGETVESPEKIVTLYKTFDPKNEMEKETENALARIDHDAQQNKCKHVIYVFGPLPEDIIEKYKNLEFIEKEKLSHEDMLEHCRKSDLVITEGQNTAYEAAALGTPVLHLPKPEQADSVGTVVKSLSEKAVFKFETPETDIFIDSTMRKKEQLKEPVNWSGLKKEALAMQRAIQFLPKHDEHIFAQISDYIGISKPASQASAMKGLTSSLEKQKTSMSGGSESQVSASLSEPVLPGYGAARTAPPQVEITDGASTSTVKIDEQPKKGTPHPM